MVQETVEIMKTVVSCTIIEIAEKFSPEDLPTPDQKTLW
jgi:hypothetical protein